EDAYRLVQRNAMKVWEQGKDFLEELLGDEEVTAALPEAEIREKFDLGYHTKHVDTIFRRVFGEGYAKSLSGTRCRSILIFATLVAGSQPDPHKRYPQPDEHRNSQRLGEQYPRPYHRHRRAQVDSCTYLRDREYPQHGVIHPVASESGNQHQPGHADRELTRQRRRDPSLRQGADAEQNGTRERVDAETLVNRHVQRLPAPAEHGSKGKHHH